MLIVQISPGLKKVGNIFLVNKKINNSLKHNLIFGQIVSFNILKKTPTIYRAKINDSFLRTARIDPRAKPKSVLTSREKRRAYKTNDQNHGEFGL